ncbi:MAG: tetratricopeptide repeat protein [Flavobacteriales bacterium]
MKKTGLWVMGICLTGASVFAQQAEIKAAQHALGEKDYKTAQVHIDRAGALLVQNRSRMKDDIVASYYYTKGNVYMGIADSAPGLSTGADPVVIGAKAYIRLRDFESGKSHQAKNSATGNWTYFDSESDMKSAMASGNYKKTRVRNRTAKYTPQLGTALQQRLTSLDKATRDAYETKDFQKASGDYVALYYLNDAASGEKRPIYLYYAAITAAQGKDFKTAAKHYQNLLRMGYTGMGKRYTLMNTKTGKREPVSSKKVGELMEKTDAYTDLKAEQLPNKQPEIYRFAAYSYEQLGDTAQALALLKKGVSAFPHDKNLMGDLGSLYAQRGDMDSYITILRKWVADDPNNAQLCCDMGRALYRKGDHQAAEKYYRKAIALKPDMGDAYFYLAVVELAPESEIIAQVNELGNSKADNAAYKSLQKKRSALYKSVVPLLEQARKYNASRKRVVLQTLKKIYADQSMDAKYEEVQAALKALDNQ